MRRIAYILILGCFALLSSCSQSRIIPDGELAVIFRDAYLVNGYVNVKGVKMDSLLIYEPIFERHGYTVEDVKYTIGNFSRRKSAKLGDVVERSIKMLEAEGEVFDKEVAILDTIDAVSTRRLRRVVRRDSVKTLYSLKDTTDFFITIKDIERGNYSVSFDYLIDSMDRNVGSYRAQCWFERDGDFEELKPKDLADTTEDGKPKNLPERKLKRFSSNTAYLSRGGVKSFSRVLNADTTYTRMMIELVDLLDKKNRPHVKIRDFEIIYTPRKEDASDILFNRLVPIKLFSDDLLPTAELLSPQDSL
ncbi:MAG: DUF4296 domain-containing protein [Rikenellaceae bacterium]